MPGWYPNSEVRRDADAALTSTPESARAIWQRVGCWSYHSFRHALVELVQEGRAVRTEEPLPGGVQRYLYRRATA